MIDRIAFILAIAPAKFITKDQFSNVHHIEASTDFVTKLMPFTNNRHFAFEESTITTIPSKGQGIKVHSFRNEIYIDQFQTIITDLKKQFNIK